MKQKIFALILLSALILGLGMPVSADVSAEDIMNSLQVELAIPDAPVEYGKSFTVTATINNVSLYVVGASQWTVNETPTPGYYDSMYDLYVGKQTQFTYTPHFYKGMLPAVTVHFDIAYGGILKRFTKDVALAVYEDEFFDKINREKAVSLVSDVKIEATLLRDTKTFKYSSLSAPIGSLKAWDKVIYRDHAGTDSALVELSDGSQVWVPYSAVSISRKNYTVYSDHEAQTKEDFVNLMGYESKTGYLVWVNLERQKVNIFMGSKGNWKLINTFSCASGANVTPTPMGEYTYCARDNAWIKPDYVVRPILYINMYRGIAFHSRLYSPYNNSVLVDSTMGTPVSHGCIRMMDEGVYWMEYYLPFDTKVVVY